MRTIKFRAWNSTQKIMKEVLELEWVWDEDEEKRTRLDIITSNGRIGDELILMQFTGLHDKSINNICIYEGDIISLQGILIGNKYETPEVLKNETNFLIEGIGTKTWTQTEKEGLARGLHYTK